MPSNGHSNIMVHRKIFTYYADVHLKQLSKILSKCTSLLSKKRIGGECIQAKSCFSFTCPFQFVKTPSENYNSDSFGLQPEGIYG